MNIEDMSTDELREALMARLKDKDLTVRVKRRCSFPDCPRPEVSKGLCGGHKNQVRRGEPLRPLLIPENLAGANAKVNGSVIVVQRVVGPHKRAKGEET